MPNFDYMFYDDYESSVSHTECRICNEKDQKIDEAGGFLENVLDHLYGRKNLNRFELERDLEELCHLLRVKMPGEDLMI